MSARAAAQLRAALDGENAPVAAQLVYQLVHELPRLAAQHPGGAAFRAAAREHPAARLLGLELTRSDTAAGVHYLAARGLLPAWVYSDGIGGRA